MQTAASTSTGAACPSATVFLSHAGEQKRHLLSCVHILLERMYGITTFLNEHSLGHCDNNKEAMRTALKGAAVGGGLNPKPI